MRLNAHLAVEGLTHHEWQVEEVIRQIRDLLSGLDAEIYLEPLAVGSDFASDDLLVRAEAMRRKLLGIYWQKRELYYLNQSLRLGHTIASLNFVKIKQTLGELASDGIFGNQ
jgi:hypothetical protein